uniref:co-chaperone GroES family protein n=1 Tax=Candidatus Electrothrix sp. TaxID=2170559 RepID=UPI004057C69A
METELSKVKVLREKVLIDPIPLEDKVTKGGIVLPSSNETQKQKAKWGEVVKVGEEVTSMKVGDKVLLGGFSVNVVELDEQEYYVCGEDSILVILPM